MKTVDAVLKAVHTTLDVYGNAKTSKNQPAVLHALGVADHFRGDPVMYVMGLMACALEQFPDQTTDAIEWLRQESDNHEKLLESLAVLRRAPGEAYAAYIKRVAESGNAPAMIAKITDIAERVKRGGGDESEDTYTEAGKALLKALMLQAIGEGEVHIVHHSGDEPASENAAPVTLH